MRYYAIADLHGRFDLLEKARNMIKEDSFDLTPDEFKVITLGDYIDRGPQSKEVIESLMESQKLFPYMICLQGNHEAMMVETIRKPLDPDWWLGNGGNTTMKSYGSEVKVSPYYGIPPVGWDPHVVYPSHVDWIANLPLYYETEKHVFVHAGVPRAEGSLEEQSKLGGVHGEREMQWMLHYKGETGNYKGKMIVHGHHQFRDGPHEWENRTNLDTFAWNTGRLVVGVFDDTQGKALRYIEVLGDDFKDTRTTDKG